MTEAPDDAAPGTGSYVYGIVRNDASRVPEGLTGLDGAPVRVVGDQEVAAVVADVALERPPGRRKDLVAHTAVLEALAELGPVVPVQFGSFLAGDDEVLADLVAPRARDLADILTSLEGRRQFNLRATYHEAGVLQEVISENPDIAALRERTRDQDPVVAQPDLVRMGELVARAIGAKRDVDTKIVLDQVLPLVAAEAVTPGNDLQSVFRASFLVDDDRRDEFEDVLEAVAEAVHERIELALTGPLPAYDFVGDVSWA